MFGKLGDIAGLMKKVRQIQEDMGKIQGELAQLEVNGTSGDGQVEVTAGGDFTIKRIIIKPECVQSNDAKLLEGLVLTAVNNALDKAKMLAKERVSEITGGLNVPGLS